MSTQTGAGTGPDQQQTQQSQNIDGRMSDSDIFNTSHEIQNEDDGTIVFDEFNSNNSQQQNQSQQQNSQSQNQQQQQSSSEENSSGEKVIDFTKSLNPDNSEGNKDDQEMIKLLKEKGYNIEKENEIHPEEKHKDLLKDADVYIQQGEDFLKLNDDQIILQSEKNELSRIYKSSGKEHLIGSEEFNNELEANVAEITDNAGTKRIHAGNIRQNIQGMIDKKKLEKESAEGEINTYNQKQLEANQQKLQESFQGIYKEGFLGLELSQEDVLAAYNMITDKKLSQKLNSNPGLVAKVALFLQKEEQISKIVGTPSYGEGVKAAIEAISKQGAQSSSNPITDGLRNSQAQSSQGSGNSNRFQSNVVGNQQKQPEKNTYVAGTGYF